MCEREREDCEVWEKEECVCLLANELRQLQKLIMSGKVNYDTNATLDTPAECLCVVCVVCRCVCMCVLLSDLHQAKCGKWRRHIHWALT